MEFRRAEIIMMLWVFVFQMTVFFIDCILKLLIGSSTNPQQNEDAQANEELRIPVSESHKDFQSLSVNSPQSA